MQGVQATKYCGPECREKDWKSHELLHNKLTLVQEILKTVRVGIIFCPYFLCLFALLIFYCTPISVVFASFAYGCSGGACRLREIVAQRSEIE